MIEKYTELQNLRTNGAITFEAFIEARKVLDLCRPYADLMKYMTLVPQENGGICLAWMYQSKDAVLEITATGVESSYSLVQYKETKSSTLKKIYSEMSDSAETREESFYRRKVVSFLLGEEFVHTDVVEKYGDHPHQFRYY